MGSFNPLIDIIKSGEPVSAGVTNRPITELEGQILYLKSLIDAAGAGQALYAMGVTIEPAVQVGMPVFYNSITQQFERALAAIATDPVTGVLTMAASAQVWGIVSAKVSANQANLLLAGMIPLDLTAALNGAALTAGIYHLSGQFSGVLLSQKPPVSVPILRADGQGNILFTPTYRDLLESHVHYRVELAALPAGGTVPPLPGHVHVITDPDPILPGWLPANDATFLGNAPLGAEFGYNINADPVLKNLWPPIPVSSAYLEWDKGEHPQFGFQGVPLGPLGKAIVDRNGIWWMTNCYGDAPWPKNWSTARESHQSDASLGPDDLNECPRDLHMRIALFFNRQVFENDVTTVTSLRSADSRIVVRCLSTADPTATTGDLSLSLNLQLIASGTTDTGWIVFKNFNNGTFSGGPVTEGLQPLSSNVSMTGTAVRLDSLGNPIYQGIVGIAVSPFASQELDVDQVFLYGATVENFGNVIYLGMATGKLSSYRGKIYVPEQIGYVTPKMRIRLWVLGRSSGTLPALALTYMRLPMPPSGLITPVALPTSDTPVAITTAAPVAASQYVEAVSAPFDVSPGDTIYFTVTRAIDGYAGQVGVIRQVGVLSGS